MHLLLLIFLALTMILMLKIASALNGSFVGQSKTTLGIELLLQVKKYYYQRQKWFIDWIFWVIFRIRHPMENDITKILFSKKWRKKYFNFFLEKIDYLLIFFLFVIFRGRQPLEDHLTNNLTSLHFPDACVTSI